MPDFYWQTPTQSHVVVGITSDENDKDWSQAGKVREAFIKSSSSSSSVSPPPALSILGQEALRILRSDVQFKSYLPLIEHDGGEFPAVGLTVSATQAGHVRPVAQDYIASTSFKSSCMNPHQTYRVHHILRIILTTTPGIVDRIKWDLPTTTEEDDGRKALFYLYRLLETMDHLGLGGTVASLEHRALVSYLTAVGRDTRLLAAVERAGSKQRANIRLHAHYPQFDVLVRSLIMWSGGKATYVSSSQSTTFRRAFCHIASVLASSNRLVTPAPYSVRYQEITTTQDRLAALGAAEHARRARVARRAVDSGLPVPNAIMSPVLALDPMLDKILASLPKPEAEYLACRRQQEAEAESFKDYGTAILASSRVVIHSAVVSAKKKEFLRLVENVSLSNEADDSILDKKGSAMDGDLDLDEARFTASSTTGMLVDSGVRDEAYVAFLELAHRTSSQSLTPSETSRFVRKYTVFKRMLDDSSLFKSGGGGFVGLPAPLEDKMRVFQPLFFEVRVVHPEFLSAIDDCCRVAAWIEAKEDNQPSFMLAIPLIEYIAKQALGNLFNVNLAAFNMGRNFFQHWFGFVDMLIVYARCMTGNSVQQQAISAALDPFRYFMGRSCPLECAKCGQSLIGEEIYEARAPENIRRAFELGGDDDDDKMSGGGGGGAIRGRPLESRLSTFANYSRADWAPLRKVIELNCRRGRGEHDDQYYKCPSRLLLGYLPTVTLIALYAQVGELIHFGCKWYAGQVKSGFGRA